MTTNFVVRAAPSRHLQKGYLTRSSVHEEKTKNVSLSKRAWCRENTYMGETCEFSNFPEVFTVAVMTGLDYSGSRDFSAMARFDDVCRGLYSRLPICQSSPHHMSSQYLTYLTRHADEYRSSFGRARDGRRSLHPRKEQLCFLSCLSEQRRSTHAHKINADMGNMTYPAEFQQQTRT